MRILVKITLNKKINLWSFDMFNVKKEYEDEYTRETACASIHQDENEESNEIGGDGSGWILSSIVVAIAVGVIGYFGFNYIKDDNRDAVSQKAVMGVSIYTKSKNTHMNRGELEKELDTLYLDEEKERITEESIRGIVREYIAQKRASTPSKQSQEISKEIDNMVDRFYTQQSIPQELDSMVNDFYAKDVTSSSKNRVITIKQGDTLGSISEHYYGSSKKIQKIIDANHNLDSETLTLQIGQKIKIPY
jgi:LysM repeat protein